jgi:hyperosmotically inducible periplasmic protein
MTKFIKGVSAIFIPMALSLGMMAQSGAGRYDSAIEAKVSQELASKKQFHDVRATTEDGIVTLKGPVALYQQKLDAAKQVRKVDNVQGVRNLIAVKSEVPDKQLSAQLNRKLYYDRIGYDNEFNFMTASVKDGVVTLNGDVMNPVDKTSALSLVANTAGVKDLIDNLKVEPLSPFDNSIRLRTLRAIYGDTILGRYGMDPALPIRIVVNNGHVTLYGTVENKTDKEVAGIRANSVPGVFSVKNDLKIADKS